MSIKQALILNQFLIGILLLTSSCKEDPITPTCINGEGAITTKVISVEDFTGIHLSFASNVTISQGGNQKVEATGHPNIIDKISADVSNNIWTIGFEDGCYENYELSIHITIPNLSHLELSGSGDLVVNDFVNQAEKLFLDVNGSGDITLNEYDGLKEIDASLSGTGSILVNKSVNIETLNLANGGTGKFSGFEMISDDCTVNSSGSGDCEIKSLNNLDVTLTGSGNVLYKGMPTITENITGSGNLIDAN